MDKVFTSAKATAILTLEELGKTKFMHSLDNFKTFILNLKKLKLTHQSFQLLHFQEEQFCIPFPPC